MIHNVKNQGGGWRAVGGGRGWVVEGKRLGGLRWFEAEKEGKWEGKKNKKTTRREKEMAKRDREEMAEQKGDGREKE